MLTNLKKDKLCGALRREAIRQARAQVCKKTLIHVWKQVDYKVWDHFYEQATLSVILAIREAI